MKKVTIILIGILIIYSCRDSKKLVYEGTWVDKKNELVQLSILNEKGSYWLKGYNEKYLIEKKEKNYFVKINSKEHTLLIDNGNLFFSQKEFIPESRSLKKQFAGHWKSQTKDTSFEIKNINGGLIWDIKEGDNKSVSYYPKITETGFLFTYKNENLSFIIQDKFIIDSNKRKYYKLYNKK